jgi:hypothetical protein
MARDFSDEESLLEAIKAEKIVVDARVLRLISHHTGNDLQAISWILSVMVDDLSDEVDIDRERFGKNLEKAKAHSDALIKKIKLLKEALSRGEIGS